MNQQVHMSVTVEKAETVVQGREASVEEVLQIAKGLKKERQFDLLRRLLVHRAKPILKPDGEKVAGKYLLAFAKALKGIQKFDFARRLLALALLGEPRGSEIWRVIVQQLASCTEKDPDMPLDRRYELAQEVIAPALAEAETYWQKLAEERHADDDRTVNAHQETFGIAGAIQKRWWQVDAQPRHLMDAQKLYEKGWQLALGRTQAGIPDQGYTGINAAFVLDLLAQQEAGDKTLVAERRQRAQDIRRQIHDKLSQLPTEKRNDWWTLVTLAEACLGQRDFNGTISWLQEARKIDPQPEPWEYETTAKQLARLAMLLKDSDASGEDSVGKAWEALGPFVGGNEAALLTAFNGKVGLALSGGGFRASLFHIGVLARLAELDMLRHVEVLSCVSGGSIIGAHYYLKLRKLLQGEPDATLTPKHYVDLVHALEEEFMAAIKNNPRMEVFSRLNRLGLRTEEMGKLLDDTLYKPLVVPTDLDAEDRPSLRKLKIRPAGFHEKAPDSSEEYAPFNPKYDNWQRQHKVPVLIINATTLNTGHNWQFTTAFMGESPNQISTEVDGNERLRRMYFDEAMPKEHRDQPLGRAVAASAAVPGLFRPVKLCGLYPGRDVELVDGGVHDNQGVSGLLEQDCMVLLISDACGQLVAESHPSRAEISVLMRSNDTLMARVRELEYKELVARQQAGLLREFMFVHLKKQLSVEPVDWEKCDLARDAGDRVGVSPDSDQDTGYGVRGDVQNLLSGIRTDLDAFCEAESYGLMISGYKMTAWEFPRSIHGFKPGEVYGNQGWHFLRLEPLMKSPSPGSDAENAKRLLGTLSLAASLLFKGPRLLPNAHVVSRRFYGALIMFVSAPAVILGVAIFHLLRVSTLFRLLLGGWCVTGGALTFWLNRGGLRRVTRRLRPRLS